MNEMLRGFTAEADQLNCSPAVKPLLCLQKVWAVRFGSGLQLLVMDYLSPRPLDAHNARLFLGSNWRAYTNGATSLNSASILTL